MCVHVTGPAHTIPESEWERYAELFHIPIEQVVMRFSLARYIHARDKVAIMYDLTADELLQRTRIMAIGYLTFKDLADANATRVMRWHPKGLQDWSAMEWACAAAGEMGECCNAVKKLKRIEDQIANLNEPERQLTDKPSAVLAIGEEIADTVIYLDLLAQRLGIDIASFVRHKFNATSKKYGFPERL